MGPRTGFTGSAFSMQTTLVGGYLAQDLENPLFGVFGQFRALNGAAKTSKSRIGTAGGRTIGSRRCTKVAQRERASDEPTISRKLPGGADLLKFTEMVFLSVGSLTDRTGPQLTKWPPAPPKTAISRAPGTHGTANRVHWVRT